MIALLIILAMWYGETGTVVKPEALRRAVEEYVRHQFLVSAQTASIEFRSLPNEIVVSNAQYSFRVAPEGPLRFSGNVSVPVEIVIKDSVERRVIVPIKVRTFGVVAFAAKQLARHGLLQKDDVEMQNVETTMLPQDVITSFEMLKEKRTTRIISQGSVLKESMMESIPLIQHDETVTLIVKSNGVEVSTHAVAKESGRRGEYIIVQKMDTREKLKAKIVNNKTVQVDVY